MNGPGGEYDDSAGALRPYVITKGAPGRAATP